ncbi:unnamed protein product [Durusdinium trenchii]|uniref:Uncharacterized protein n=1 Tax=Durusdinium trenchii TaxID=1381693 RepID=A0ABP0R321_9DINO
MNGPIALQMLLPQSMRLKLVGGGFQTAWNRSQLTKLFAATLHCSSVAAFEALAQLVLLVLRCDELPRRVVTTLVLQAACGLAYDDSEACFKDDTLGAGETNGELANLLCRNSLPDMSWLVDKFDLDFSVVSKLSCHSRARTSRTKDSTPGMAITYALMQMVEKVAEVSDRARLVTKAEVFQLLLRDGNVVGCQYRKSGCSSKEYGPVVLCTGLSPVNYIIYVRLSALSSNACFAQENMLLPLCW